MASIGHVVIGALAGRIYASGEVDKRKTVAAVGGFGLLALLPDFDVLWVGLGAPDHGAMGHRGFTHTVAFALLIAIGLSGLILRRNGVASARRAFWFVAATVASHGLLDALTFDSRGVMLFWPLSEAKVAFSWRPIPSAPTGLAFVGVRGFEVVAVELLFFAPVVLATLWPPRSFQALRSSALAVTGVAAMVACSLFFAEVVWRNVKLVSDHEVSSPREFAIREQHRLRTR